MKISESTLNKIITEEVQSVISELKYNKVKSIINKCVNEAFEEQMTDMATDEPAEAIDFHKFEEICSSNGWHWYNSFDVKNPEGQTGVRFVFSPSGSKCPFEDLVKQVKNAANNPDGIITGMGQHRHAPEMKHPYIIILD